MKIKNLNTGNTHDIDLRKVRGEEQITCPECSHTRKKKTDKCFSWNHDKNTGHCFNCSGSFVVFRALAEKKEYARPEWQNNTELTDKAVKWFEGRGITQFTLRAMKVTSGKDWMPQFNKEVETIHFNYFRGEKLINIKYRGAEKSFKLHKDAELIFYNINGLHGSDSAIIVEGEIDQLTLMECGYNNAISVPNGAKNFEFLDNCYEDLENLKKVYIAVDNDEAGMILRNELIRRIGADRCLIVDFGEKDANDCLTKHGKDAIINAVNEAKEVPIEGVVFVANVYENMINTFRYGKRHGTTTYLPGLDKHWTWRAGEVNLWTGYNNEGKSTFLYYLSVLKAKEEGEKFAIFSPENYPVEDFYDELIHAYVGKAVDKRYQNVMSEVEYENGAEFINQHFFAVIPDENNQLSTILSKMLYLIRKYGVKHCIIDPYNQIEHLLNIGEREDLYISRFMSTLKRFSVDNSVSMHLVAHQVTPMFTGKDADYPRPDTYKIKGGGTFSDKADNVLAVWRPYRKSEPSNTTVKIIIGKIKKQRLVGLPGEIDYNFDFAKNCYYSEVNNYIPINENAVF